MDEQNEQIFEPNTELQDDSLDDLDLLLADDIADISDELEELSPEKPATPKTYVAEKKRPTLMYYGILLIFASLFLVCSVYLLKYFTDTGNAQDDYNQLASIHHSATDPTLSTAPSGPISNTDPSGSNPAETKPLEMLPDMKAIYELNNDLVGWIRLEALKIDYPVMQTPNDRDYYLYRNFYKEQNDTGCLYIREACDVFKPSDNVVIYGHAMKTGDMFGRLYYYREKDFWEKNQYLTFDTLYERHTYQIFAVFVTSGTQQNENNSKFGYPYHRLNDFRSEESFDKFIADVKGAAFTGENAYLGYSLYDTGITPKYGDKIVCLSTCEYTIDNGRLVVMAVRVS